MQLLSVGKQSLCPVIFHLLKSAETLEAISGSKYGSESTKKTASILFLFTSSFSGSLYILGFGFIIVKAHI